MKNMWFRVGVSIDLTDEEYKSLKKAYNTDYRVAAEKMVNILMSDKAKLDGETYSPIANMEFNF